MPAKGMPMVLLLALVPFTLFAACDGGEEDVDAEPADPSIPTPAYDWSDEPWNVVVSLPIFADFVREMGGDQVAVASLIPPGADPHTFVPDDEAATLVQEADLVLVNGLGLDQPTIDFVQANRPDGRLFMVDFVRNVPSPSTQQPIGGFPIFAKEVGDNPHLYLDPELVSIYAETVSHSMVIIDEINEPYYDALFAAYVERIKALHQHIESDMAAIPAENRSLVTEHDSMIHWANRYGLTIAGTLAEDGEDAIRSALESGQPNAVFTEVGMGDGALESIASDYNARVCALSTDSIEEEDRPYIEMMESNSAEILSCLGGEAR